MFTIRLTAKYYGSYTCVEVDTVYEGRLHGEKDNSFTMTYNEGWMRVVLHYRSVQAD